MNRDTVVVSAAALLAVLGLATTQALSRGPSPTAGTSATPSAGSSTSTSPAPSGPDTIGKPDESSPIPASWTVVDRRPHPDPDLRVARNDTVEDPHYPELSHPEVDALRYELDLNWDGERLEGGATIQVRMTRDVPEMRLALDRRLDVDWVTIDDEDVDVRRDGDSLVLPTDGLTKDSEHAVFVAYSGAPSTVPSPTHRPDDEGGLGWGYDEDGNVSTYQEPYGAYTWYPVNEHPSDKAFYEFVVTAPRGQVGVANGRLVDRWEDEGRTVTDWRLDSPASSYLTTLAIGRYRQHVQTLRGGVTASVWTLPDDEDAAPQLQAAVRESFTWLSERAGPYPFDTTGMVVTAGQSAMETQTLVTMGRAPARQALREVTLHELAHQWYGDSVTTRDWTSTWLNEGWATYWEARYTAEVLGDAPDPADALERCRRSVRVAGQAGNPKKDWFADPNIYVCPALMLEEVHRQAGDAAFAQLARQWPATYRYRTAGRAEFEALAQSVTGVAIRPLTRRWLDAVDPDAPTPTKPTSPAPAPTSTTAPGERTA